MYSDLVMKVCEWRSILLNVYMYRSTAVNCPVSNQIHILFTQDIVQERERKTGKIQSTVWTAFNHGKVLKSNTNMSINLLAPELFF